MAAEGVAGGGGYILGPVIPDSHLGIDELLRLMKQYSVPAERVFTAAEMIDDPHYLARGMVQLITSRQGIELPTLGVVPKFSRTPGSINDVGPLLGEHTERHRQGDKTA